LLHPPLILIISISRTHPVSTLFPYTTLFRSWNAEIAISLISRRSRALLTFSPTKRQRLPSSGNGYHPLRHLPSGSVSAFCLPIRSEEHTSELQSRENLVCRLLLDKKKMLRT